MRLTIVYGTEHKGATYHIAQEVISSFKGAEIEEIFLPRDLPEYCSACLRCFCEEKGSCSHKHYTEPLRAKLLAADILILTSPVYAYHMSGQMKVFLDHFANMWMVHRPEKAMFLKQAIVIAAASGPVYAKTLNGIKDSLDFWGVAKTYKIGVALMESEWQRVSPKVKARVSRRIQKVIAQVKKRQGKVKPCWRVKKWFYISRFMQKKIKANPPDVLYWEEQGWTGKVRPWKNN
ncbi:flavin reductase [Sporanaerobium hydrogeniformans]|uniref:Flavin reductase n=1 Tax=Sporanaerobium hydrogeniformans TaxID=3072179 RepID=A0AC61DF18_9FIRM|nr:flavodoxin family protein [Sporanaerobium hydrogeniformans]PHV71790.1 flavin reductase [Sporanaerobium hydrogeniformans]